MKDLFREAEILAKEAEDIMLDILTHNPDIPSLRNVASIKDLQHEIAVLMKRYSRLYKMVGEKLHEK